MTANSGLDHLDVAIYGDAPTMVVLLMVSHPTHELIALFLNHILETFV
jgi:hypothetical protein